MTGTTRARPAPPAPDREAPEPIPEAVIAGLAEPGAYPGDPSAVPAGVTCVQTHLSCVYLTGDRVYKLRKAVDLGFVRFATRAERNADCLREVALNRRLAPDVYLGVAPIARARGRVRVGPIGEALAGGDGPTPEHVVVMRRLPDGRDALSLCARGALRGEQVDAVAARVAAFHERHRLRGAARPSRATWLERCTLPVRANFASLESAAGRLFPAATWRRAQRLAEAFIAEHADRFEARRRAGRGVDGHGDLHLQHVWFERDDASPLMIDCLEFRDDLRHIDAACDAAFLAMDLRYRRRARLADRFLRRYARDADDFDLFRVVDYFESYRAAVRAKVAAVAADDAGIAPAQRAGAAESARRHLALSARLLRPRAGGALVVVCGVVGTGKSTVAEVAADALGGAVVASDRVRKRLAGLAPTAPGGRALYTEARKDATYAALLERARPVLESGRAAVVDATYARRAHRDAARRLAAELSVPALLVETRCAEEVARERLARRQAAQRDASDAGPDYYPESARSFEPTGEWPRHGRIRVHTDARGWRRALRDRLRRA